MKKKKESKDKHLHQLVLNNFKQSLSYIKESQRFIWFSTLAFFLLAILGFLFPYFFENEILSLIKNLILQTQGLSGFDLIGFIFMNNLKSSLFAMVLGIFFAAVPLMVLVVNGYVLGFVASKTVAIEGFSVLWRLVPHGIFEIPAVLISIGLGLRLGFFWVNAKEKARSFLCLASIFAIFIFASSFLIIIFSMISSIGDLEEYQGVSMDNMIQNPIIFLIIVFILILSVKIGMYVLSKQDKKQFTDLLKNSFRVFLFLIVPLLTIAAIIEGILIYLLG